jgi:hypothetical protein
MQLNQTLAVLRARRAIGGSLKNGVLEPVGDQNRLFAAGRNAGQSP